MAAALVAGTVAAMVVTQKLRREGPVASSIRLKTKPESRYRICFRLTRDDVVDVDMVGTDGTLARRLADRAELAGGDTPQCYDWDGRTAAGEPVPPGLYKLRLSLIEADRVATSGERLQVTAAEPEP